MLVHTMAEAFAAEVAQLCATPVTPTQWSRFLDVQVPKANAQGQPLDGRALTLAEKKRDTLQRLYRFDERVAPWAGTAHGTTQAVNTYEHHEAVVRGASRAERNMLRTIGGDFAQLDRATWTALAQVLLERRFDPLGSLDLGCQMAGCAPWTRSAVIRSLTHTSSTAESSR